MGSSSHNEHAPASCSRASHTRVRLLRTGCATQKKEKRSCTNDIGGAMGEGVEGEDEIQFLRTVSTFSPEPRVRVAQCGCGV